MLARLTVPLAPVAAAVADLHVVLQDAVATGWSNVTGATLQVAHFIVPFLDPVKDNLMVACFFELFHRCFVNLFKVQEAGAVASCADHCVHTTSIHYKSALVK